MCVLCVWVHVCIFKHMKLRAHLPLEPHPCIYLLLSVWRKSKKYKKKKGRVFWRNYHVLLSTEAAESALIPYHITLMLPFRGTLWAVEILYNEWVFRAVMISAQSLVDRWCVLQKQVSLCLLEVTGWGLSLISSSKKIQQSAITTVTKAIFTFSCSCDSINHIRNKRDGNIRYLQYVQSVLTFSV